MVQTDELDHTFEKLMKIDPKDLKFTPVNADPDFDPEHNRRVIEKTLRDYEKTRSRKQREFDQSLGERSEAARRYLKNIEKGGKTSAISYFGRGELARLRGLEVIEMLKKART